MNHAQAIKRIGHFGFLTSTAAAALLVAEACSDTVSESLIDAGTALVDAGYDAGQILRDAGMSMRDAGTDAGAQAESHYKSGSRIKMRLALQNGADGSQHGGYPIPFDSMLNTNCSLAVAADGKTRCLPTATSVSYSNFADSACTQMLAFVYGSCPMPAIYASQAVAGASCQSPATTRIYNLGAAHTGTFYSKSTSGCTMASLSAEYHMYRVGAEIPPSSFVEFTAAGSADL